MATILIVDDDEGVREVMEIMLQQEGYDVTSTGEPLKAIEISKKRAFDLIITDLKMPKINGIEYLKSIKDQRPDAMVILITAYASGETAINAMKEGAYDYVEKGENWQQELKKVVSSALKKKGVINDSPRENTNQNKEGDSSFCGMIGTNREMIKVFATIKKVADTPANILILGESGTGKELVARAIHENSSRSKMPFMAINSGGIPENLLESELFGYMKGSFTGAYADKAGIFEMARGGTIFLDEIGDLPSVLQVKLLRVVQEKTFRRIGGAEDIKVDVRIISATNQDLTEKVRKGEFREDLFYRLNVIPIYLPPLRERRDDVPLLINEFIDKYARLFGKEIRNISSYAMELLMNYNFPGNIRELENIIERSVAMETSNIILPENLTFDTPKFDMEIDDRGIDLNAELDRIEKTMIEKALIKSKGSKKKTAELLQITFDSLRHRIEKLGVGEN
jgi:two-component system response regulator PilR (NtrC family)